MIYLIGALYAYRVFLALVGVFFTRRFPKARKQHNYAIVVAARNEETVIGNLLASIAKQNYPADKITVFVVADNCTDRTAEIARQYGAVCYERFDDKHCTKGYAMQYLFKRIEEEYRICSFDGYFVFDADNLLKSDFVSCMNDAFDGGEKIITSYRSTKNFNSNYISAGYALHWMRTSRLESRGRSVLNISTRLQGTGYLISSELLRDGWRWTSLTEDRELSAEAVSEGVRITYQHEAEFYDEQPVSWRIAWMQRVRWAKGNLYVFSRCFNRLANGMVSQKGLTSKMACYDMQLTNLPYCMVMVPLKILSAFLMAFTFPPILLFCRWCLKYSVSLSLSIWLLFPPGCCCFSQSKKRFRKYQCRKNFCTSLPFRCSV